MTAASIARSPGGLELGYLMLQAGRLIQNAMEDAAAEAGMPGLDLLALYVLGEHEGLTGGALARLLYVQQSSVTPLADRLEAAGLIERERDENDRRRVWLCPTPQGETMAREATSKARDAVRHVFAPLSPGSATALAALLGDVVEPWLAEVSGPRPISRDGPA
ncbi:MarR family winged helix-turn-helix transcriptional regulator [Actinoplanes aureus]|uniref:Winged helix-turn-helix transcriptional regulator n=1 Tax=Actinoplanes aureus TaxID=2792083 RepID=A0A931C5I4_9ACTN|nr:MarR family winged helix-turn-helix transcriptional regulator [Actinoplanes aureus]MBG0561007.1 winged helix-turn-helix transcriptional regulator [Actinoplanes aureus]